MISGYEKLRVPDINKEKDFTIEVNWNPYDKQTKDCKVLRFTFPGGDTALVKREHFQAVLFALATEDDQRKMIPETVTRIRNYETVLGITAKKDIRKGEKINVAVKIPIPLTQDDVLAGGDKKRTIIGNK